MSGDLGQELFDLAKGMTSMQQADADARAVAHLDFDPTCGMQTVYTIGADIVSESERCGAPAVWLVECITCGHTVHICDECRERSLLAKRTRCKGCDVKGDPFFLFTYTPLGGAA